MKFHSTRGGDKNVTFKEAFLMGYAKDGGMFLPEIVPQVSSETLQQWAKLKYKDLAFEVLSLYIGDEVPSQDLKDILCRAFSTFPDSEVIPVKTLTNGLVIFEMFHGRSLSFKDIAMCCVGNFFNYFLAKENKHTTLIVCTSGDTGSSAIEAVRGSPNIDIIVLLPRGWITPIQEKQMTTAIDSNVHVVRFDGCSEDGDFVVKGLFADTDFVAQHCLGSASSLNVCRILIQVVHFFYTYLKMCPEADKEVELILPTGGGGNTASGSLARKMGLPIKLRCAVNKNNTLSRFMESGQCDIGEVKCTIAPAMDIQFPYNFERVWYMCSDEDSEAMKKIMADIDGNKVDVSTTIMNNLRKYLSVYTVSGDEEVQASMKRCWDENEYKICPHTGVGVSAFYAINNKEKEGENILRAIFATASPLKFPEASESAGVPIATSDVITKLLVAPTKYDDWEKGEDWMAIVKRKIEEISARVKL